MKSLSLCVCVCVVIRASLCFVDIAGPAVRAFVHVRACERAPLAPVTADNAVPTYSAAAEV